MRIELLAAAAGLILPLAAATASAQSVPSAPVDAGAPRVGRSVAAPPTSPAEGAPGGGALTLPRTADRGCMAERELRVDPAAAPLHLGTETYPQTVELGEREIVLTFDDGPSPDTTPAVLRALREACVHATFFLIGRNAAAHPQIARREVEEGHTVGHHSNTHPAFTLRGFDVASGEKDVAAGIAADEAAIYGVDAGSVDHPHVPFFRFPGFADSPELLTYLDAHRIAVFGTDLWAADWLMMTPEQERRRVLGLLERRPLHNGIILFHDTKRATAEMLPALLRDLRRAHYTIVHLVYSPGAPVPALTAPRSGPSETEKIIARLRTPIVPGAHRL